MSGDRERTLTRVGVRAGRRHGRLRVGLWPSVLIVAAIRGGAWHVDQRLQRLPPYTDRLLRTLATELRKPKHWGSLDGIEFPTENEDLIYAMMTLVYSGNADQADRLLDLTWPPGKPGKKKAASDFWVLQQQSRYWPEISTLAKIKVDGRERDTDANPICYEAGGS